MAKEQAKVYALVLNYNSARETIGLFRNLEEDQYQNLEILVIDNNSEDGDQRRQRENIPKEYLIFNKTNLGFAGGNNVGIRRALKAGAEYVWILNPDVRLEKNSLSQLVETLKSDQKLAAVGPRILQREATERIFSDGEKMKLDEEGQTIHKNHNLKEEGLPKGIDYDIDYIAGCSILLNVKAIKEIGSLPEEYFLYFEETDWCFKARQSGWKIAINTNSVVYNLTSEKTAVFHYYYIRNKLIFCKKYHPDFKAVRSYKIKELTGELVSRIKGRYLRPYFLSRLKGLISGIIKTSF